MIVRLRDDFVDKKFANLHYRSLLTLLTFLFVSHNQLIVNGDTNNTNTDTSVLTSTNNQEIVNKLRFSNYPFIKWSRIFCFGCASLQSSWFPTARRPTRKINRVGRKRIFETTMMPIWSDCWINGRYTTTYKSHHHVCILSALLSLHLLKFTSIVGRWRTTRARWTARTSPSIAANRLQ